MRIGCNVTGVHIIFNKIRPPGAKFQVLDLAILQLELEVCIYSHKLCIDPSCKLISICRILQNKFSYSLVPQTLSQSSGRFRPKWGHTGHSIASEPDVIAERGSD